MSLPAYHNPALTAEDRVADLLSRMTLQEKVGQLMLWDARGEDLSVINTRQPGSVPHILGAKIDRAMDLAARNRLGIPLLVGAPPRSNCRADRSRCSMPWRRPACR